MGQSDAVSPQETRPGLQMATTLLAAEAEHYKVNVSTKKIKFENQGILITCCDIFRTPKIYNMVCCSIKCGQIVVNRPNRKYLDVWIILHTFPSTESVLLQNEG